MTQGPCAAPPGTCTERAALAFFDRVGVPVDLVLPISECIADYALVFVSLLMDGVPSMGAWGSALGGSTVTTHLVSTV